MRSTTRFARSPKASAIPTKAEQARLCSQAQAGDLEARAELLESQTGLVKRLAHGYTHAGGIDTSWHLQLDDVIQEAWFAVMDAVKYYDSSRGFCFSTYAASCIRRRLWRFTQHRNTLPIGMQEPDDETPDPHGTPFDANLSPIHVAPGRPDPESCVGELMPQLSPCHRAVVRMRAAGRRDREIAEELGITICAARKLMGVRVGA